AGHDQPDAGCLGRLVGGHARRPRPDTCSGRVSPSYWREWGRAQAGRRLSFRICLSNAQAGTKRRRALTRRAVEPAVYRSFGFGSVAAATMDLATVAGESPPSIALAITRSNACRCAA